MKRFIFLLIIGFSVQLSAQDSGSPGNKTGLLNSRKFELGISGGPGLISLYGNKVLEDYHKPSIGFGAGLTAQYNFPKIFSLRAEFGFARKGSQLNETINITDGNGNVIGTDEYLCRYHFDYLQSPLMIRASIGKKMKYFINTGIYGAYLLNQKFVIKQTDFVTGHETSEISLFERFDYGTVAGLGIEYPLGDKFAAGCEIRNYFGLYNTSKIPVYNNGTIKTNSTNLLFSFAYQFGSRQ